MRITLLLVLGLSLPSSQDPRHDAAMLRQAQQLAVPVAQHQRLQRLTGEWKVASQAMGTTSEGVVAGQSMLGDRYVVLRYRLPRAGRELEAVQLLGFDTLHQVYTSSWRDDASTWSVEASGSPDPEAPDRLVLRGSVGDARDPSGRPYRIEFDLGRPDEVTVQLFDTIDGKDVRVETQRWRR